jgi:hypothetical protein
VRPSLASTNLPLTKFCSGDRGVPSVMVSLHPRSVLVLCDSQ